MKTITITLENSAECELDRKTVNVPESKYPDEAISAEILVAIEDWMFSPGDKISIGQIEEEASKSA